MDEKQTEALRIATESLPMLKIAASLGDETGQISFHSSHLLNLIEGYAAARQEIASLTAQPYDQQAMGLCHACGWKGVIDYPDGPVCVACEHDKTLSPQPAAQALDSVRVFWQQHTKSDALSMTMAELHTDVELVIRAARGAAKAQDALKKAGAIAVSAAKTNSRDIADWREDIDRIAAIAAQEGNHD